MSVFLSHLSVVQFRNHREARLNLGRQVNCFVGQNGAGKTNLLDAVYYLSMCKSYFEPQDTNSIMHGEEWFVVKGTMETPAGPDDLSCAVAKGKRKVFKRNHKEYERLADHVGRYPVVMVTPYDGQLVLDGSDVRRRFLDGLISQFDRDYLEHLIRYNRALAQRNLLLKQHHGPVDRATVEPWDRQLCQHGTVVHRVRKAFMADVAPALQRHYAAITSGPERVGMEYRSELNEEPLEQLLHDRWERDLAAQHTTAGVHKDDLVFSMDERPLKKYGSQGQQKTFLIALKLAQFDLTAKRTGQKPILLLDDIFDKIDPLRMRHLLQLLGDGQFGQVVITDTDAARLHHALDGLQLDTRFFHLDATGITVEQAPQTMEQP